MIKRISLLMVIIFTSVFFAKAQQHFNAPGGQQINAKYTEIDGSPYFLPYWVKAVVKLKNGTTYKDMDVKLDEVEQKLIFKNTDGGSLYFADPVAEVKMTYIADNTNHQNYFKTGYGSKPNDFYEVLADGTVQLLKFSPKTIKENRPYGSATTVKSIDGDSEYYLFKDGKLNKVGRSKKSVINVLGNKQKEVDAYIKANNLDLSSDEDFAKLIIYYNSI